jgi:hypothetical protein
MGAREELLLEGKGYESAGEDTRSTKVRTTRCMEQEACNVAWGVVCTPQMFTRRMDTEFVQILYTCIDLRCNDHCGLHKQSRDMRSLSPG